MDILAEKVGTAMAHECSCVRFSVSAHAVEEYYLYAVSYDMTHQPKRVHERGWNLKPQIAKK